MSSPALMPASQRTISQYLRPQSPAPVPSAAGAMPLGSKSDDMADGTVIISSSSNDEASDGDTSSTASRLVRPLTRRRRICDDDDEVVAHAVGDPSCSSAAPPRDGAALETLHATGSRSTRPRTAAPTVSWSIVAVFLPTVNFRYCRLWLIRLEIHLAAALHPRVLVQLPRRNSEVFLTLTFYSQAVDLRILAL